jgi:hypothetical protein
LPTFVLCRMLGILCRSATLSRHVALGGAGMTLVLPDDRDFPPPSLRPWVRRLENKQANTNMHLRVWEVGWGNIPLVICGVLAGARRGEHPLVCTADPLMGPLYRNTHPFKLKLRVRGDEGIVKWPSSDCSH